jgi:hypothetical protein
VIELAERPANPKVLLDVPNRCPEPLSGGEKQVAAVT